MSDSQLSAFPPVHKRTHEVCGAGAYMFALAFAAHLNGPCLWVQERRDRRQVNPAGFAAFMTPAHMIVCRTDNQPDTLAVAEDALRSGAVPLVIVVLSQAIGLTEGRRLQLAARDGHATGLAIIPEGMGSNAAETRWLCRPEYAAEPSQDSTLQRWDLIKNKSGTLGAWYVRWETASRRITVVSSARE